MRRQEGDGVDVRAVRGAGADLEVEVRAGDVAGGTGEADLLAGREGLTHRDGERGQVAVLRVVAVGVLDDDLVAVRATPAAW